MPGVLALARGRRRASSDSASDGGSSDTTQEGPCSGAAVRPAKPEGATFVEAHKSTFKGVVRKVIHAPKKVQHRSIDVNVVARARRRFNEHYVDLKNPQEQAYVSSVLNALPLMVKTNEWVRQLWTVGCSEEVVDITVQAIHNVKECVARLCWTQHVERLQDSLKTVERRYESLKSQFNDVRTEYLHEVTCLRDQLRPRVEVPGGHDITQWYDPVCCLSEAELDFMVKAVTEKVKMICEQHPDLKRTVNPGQVATMAVRAERNESERMKKMMQEKDAQIESLAQQVETLEGMLNAAAPQPDIAAAEPIKQAGLAACVCGMRERCEGLESDLGQQLSINNDLQEELSRLHAQLEACHGETAASREETAAAKAHGEGLSVELAAARSEVAAAKETEEVLRDQNFDLQRQLENMRRSRRSSIGASRSSTMCLTQALGEGSKGDNDEAAAPQSEGAGDQADKASDSSLDSEEQADQASEAPKRAAEEQNDEALEKLLQVMVGDMLGGPAVGSQKLLQAAEGLLSGDSTTSGEELALQVKEYVKLQNTREAHSTTKHLQLAEAFSNMQDETASTIANLKRSPALHNDPEARSEVEKLEAIGSAQSLKQAVGNGDADEKPLDVFVRLFNRVLPDWARRKLRNRSDESLASVLPLIKFSSDDRVLPNIDSPGGAQQECLPVKLEAPKPPVGPMAPAIGAATVVDKLPALAAITARGDLEPDAVAALTPRIVFSDQKPRVVRPSGQLHRSSYVSGGLRRPTTTMVAPLKPELVVGGLGAPTAPVGAPPVPSSPSPHSRSDAHHPRTPRRGGPPAPKVS